MPDGRFVSYLRDSTAEKAKEGFCLDAQRSKINKYLHGGAWTLLKEITEIERVRHNDRPGLTEALALCRNHRATLIIAKLDNLVHNVRFLSELIEADVDFVALDMPSANCSVIHVLAEVAKRRFSVISKRTKTGLAATKASGKKLGGRRVSAERFAAISAEGLQLAKLARLQRKSEFAREIRPVIEEIRTGGIKTFQGIAVELNARGELTPKRKQWSAVQVRRVMIGS